MNRWPRAEIERLAARRRPFDKLEATLVRAHLDQKLGAADLAALRYATSFARLTTVRNRDGQDVEVAGINQLHAMGIQEAIEHRLAGGLPDVLRAVPDLVEATRRARRAVLDHLPVDRDSLEEEVTTRKLAVVSGGGGGAGYVYPGVYESLERSGLTPDLMVGTSIGSLMAMFRSRLRRYDPAPMVAAARSLAWAKVFRILETESRYGLPATLRLYLRAALGHLFKNSDESPLRLSQMGIPLYVVATGITVDALKHDLDYYQHVLSKDVARGRAWSARGVIKTIGILREFLSRREALRMVVLGRDAGTEDFDVLDAAGFSAAIPGIIHYDVLRDDPRMTRILDQLYASWGITRLGEGGMTANVPARVAWETVTSGQFGRRNVFVLALDCFAPNVRTMAWLPLQQLVKASNVDDDRRFADVYVPFPRTLSPMHLVPTLRDLFLAMRWGRAEIEPHLPFVKAMVAPIPVLPGGEAP
jgi:predicted acylesterase/phospholipase RssA